MKNRKILSTLLAFMLLSQVFTGCTPQNDTGVKEPTNDQKVIEPIDDQNANEPNAQKKEVYRNPTVSSAEEAITLLKEGNTRFVNNELANYDLGQTRRSELTEGQSPFAVVVACSDSRVVPEHLFDQGLGDLFIIRVAGNILDDAEIGSIEYGVDHLGSPLVVILGHESCGAVTAAVEKAENPTGTHTTENIDEFLDNIEPAVAKAKEANLEGKELVDKAVDLNVEFAIAQLLDESSIVKDGVNAGKLKVIGAKYLLSNGNVEWFE
ncbi:MAG: carbonic anhydrase [Tissierellaceae bacterium]|nr:carbonic anhydrase [Tissierellaceae bacterium]